MGGSVYTPRQRNWHWYNDAADASMVAIDSKSENQKPTLPNNTSIIRLRVTIAETGGKGDTSVTMKLQYSTNDSTFYDLGSSTPWNYANGVGTEGSAVSSQLMSDATTKNEYCESATNVVSIGASTTNELDFAIVPTATIGGGTTYYFRVVGDGTAIALDTGETHPQVLTAVLTVTKTTSLDSMIQKQAKAAITTGLGAMLQKQAISPKTASLHAYLQQVKTVYANLDALIKVLAKTNDIDLDAMIRKIDNTRISSLDAYLVTVVDKTASLDAYLAAVKTKTSSLDSYLKALDKTRTTSLDSMLQKNDKTKATSVDAMLQVLVTKAASLDALLKIADQTKEVSIDAYLAIVKTVAVGLDSYIKKIDIPIVTGLDAILSGATNITASLDALLKMLDKVQTTTLDAMLQIAALTRTAPLDAMLQAVKTRTTSLGALLQAAGLTRTVGVDGLIMAQGQTEGLSLDALIQSLALTKTTGLDAILEILVGPHIDLVIDALLQGNKTRSVLFDGLLQGTGIASADLGAMLAFRFTGSSMLDAILIEAATTTADINIDAYLVSYGAPSRTDAVSAKSRITKIIAARRR